MADMILHATVPYRAMVRYGKSRTNCETLLAANVTFGARIVDPHDAPVTITISGHASLSRLDWRLFEGRLFRPLIDSSGSIICADGLRAAALHSANWFDCPFALADQKGKSFHELSEDVRIVASAEREDVAAASAVASRDLIVIEGTIYRAAPAPVWTLMTGRQHRVELILPDVEEGAPARFRCDRRDEAMAFYVNLADRDDIPPNAYWVPLRDIELGPGEVQVSSFDGIEHDEAASFRAAADAIEYGIAPATLGATPFPLIAAYVDALRIGRSLDRFNPPENSLDEAAAAMNRYLVEYAAASDRSSDDPVADLREREFSGWGWPRGAQTQAPAFAMVMRRAIEARPELEGDLSGLRM